jgi:oligosaccharyltransferase complex subunit gamma
VFCTAKHLLDKPQLGLRKMRREFGTVAKTARKTLAEHAKGANASSPASPLDALFFATLDFEQAREAFHRLGVQSLPWVISVSPAAAVPAEGDIELLGDAVMRHARYGHRHWSAADFARFASDRIEAWRGEGGGDDSAGPASSSATAFPPAIVIHEAPPRPSVVNVFLGLAMLSGLAAVGWKLYNSRLAKSLPLWTLACLSVWWFSTSGGMYNIIRGMPMVLPQRDGTVKLFMDGSGQVGFEGFLMGSLYATVGLAFLAVSAAATRLADEGSRRVAGYSALCLAWFAYRRVVSIHNWKTSFGWHSFLW